MNNHRSLIATHIKEHAAIYLFITILFLTGIVFGAMLVNHMEFIQKQQLFFDFEQYINELKADEKIKNKDVFLQSIFFHTKYLSVLFLLGLTIIGIPLIWLFIFLKGLAIGFAVGFIVNQLGWQGFLYAAIAIAPQNIFIIPAYLFAGSLAMLFSIRLIHIFFRRTVESNIQLPLAHYSVSFLLLLTLAYSSAFIEAYMANELFRIIIQTTSFILLLE